MTGDRALVHLVGQAYEAALDPQGWLPFLSSLQEQVKSTQAFFYVHDYSEPAVELHAQIGLEQDFQESYRDYYIKKNVFLDRVRVMKVGSVYLTRALIPDASWHDTEFYNDWAKPQGVDHGISAVVTRDGNQLGLFGFLRRSGDSDVEADVVELMGHLMPHLLQAVRLHERVSKLRAREALLLDLLDDWSQGVVLVDGRGSILHENKAAEALLSAGDGIRRVDGHLRAAHSEDGYRLEALVRSAGVTRNHPTRAPGGVLRVAKTKTGGTLHIMVAPLPSQLSSRVVGASCVVFITDPNALWGIAGERLQGLFNLTPKEAQVASLLLHGHSIKAISAQMGVTFHTTRTHVNDLLEKTATRRQVDLVRVLMSASVLRINPSKT